MAQKGSTPRSSGLNDSCAWLRSRIENPGGLRPGWQGFQRCLELRGNLRGGGDAVADAGRTARHGIFANRLSEHPYWSRDEGDRAWPASPRSIGCRRGQCVQEWRAGNGAEQPRRRARLEEVEGSGKEIFASLPVMESPIDCEQKR